MQCHITEYRIPHTCHCENPKTYDLNKLQPVQLCKWNGCWTPHCWHGAFWVFDVVDLVFCCDVMLPTASDSACSCTSSLCPVKPQLSKLHSGYSPIGLVLICGCFPASRERTSCDCLVTILYRYVAYLMEYVSSMLCILSEQGLQSIIRSIV